MYQKALREGKEKIPYCSMLILGDEKVGKTSLYRQLVGKDFEKKWYQTKGIKRNTVDAIDTMALDIDKWEEKESSEEDGGFIKALSKEVVKNLPPQDDGDIKIPPPQPSAHPSIPLLKPPELQNKIDVSKPGKENPPSLKTPPNATLLDANPAEEEPAAMLNRGQSSILDIAVKERVVDSKNPSLELTTLDFAGQKLYRPMHHCFISRQALYIVVFKIPDILVEASRKKSLEEVRYWIHSIHSHFYPLLKEDEKFNRVLLVGTHRGDHTDEDLKEIDKLIKNELRSDDRCINHIRSFNNNNLSCQTNYFIPVDNKIDHKKKNYLHRSGTRDVQIIVKEMSTRLPFLYEYHPIKWLKFEERLKEKKKTLSTTPVMKVEEVKALAIRSNITSEYEQKLALNFFHDTGKIICICELQCSYLR